MSVFLGVLIAAVALGGAHALRNEVRPTTVTHTPESRIHCSENAVTRSECQVLGSVNGYHFIPASTSTESYKPDWVDPIAIVIAVAGVACGVVLVTQGAMRRRRAQPPVTVTPPPWPR